MYERANEFYSYILSPKLTIRQCKY